MQKAKETQDLFGEAAARTTEAVTLWADASRKIAAQGAALSASAAREGARLYADLLESNTQAVLRASEQAQASVQDSVRGVQDTVTEVLGNVRKLFTPAEG